MTVSVHSPKTGVWEKRVGRFFNKKNQDGTLTPLIPQPHQIRVLNFMHTNKGLILYHATGTGKTLSALICAVDFLLSSPEHLVYIVVPPSTIHSTWKKTIDTYISAPLEYSSIADNIKSRIRIITFNQLKLQTAQSAFLKPDKRIWMYIIDEAQNYVMKPLDKKLMKPKKTPITDDDPLMEELNVDTPIIKTPQGKHKIVKKYSFYIRKACVNSAARVLFLTATPIVNSFGDIRNMIQNIMIVSNPDDEILKRQLEIEPDTQVNQIIEYPDSKIGTKVDLDIESMDDTQLGQYLNQYRPFFDFQATPQETGDFPEYKILFHKINISPSYERQLTQQVFKPKQKETVYKTSVAYVKQRAGSLRIPKKQIKIEEFTLDENQKYLSDKIQFLLGNLAADTVELNKSNFEENPQTREQYVFPNLSQTRTVVYFGIDIRGMGKILPALIRNKYGDQIQLGCIFGDTSQEERFKAVNDFNDIVPKEPVKTRRVRTRTALSEQSLIMRRQMGIADISPPPEPTKKRRKTTQPSPPVPASQSGYKLGKLLFISKAGAEGIDLKCVKHVVFLDMVWHQAAFDQIKGRGVRYRSHLNCPWQDVMIHLVHLVDPRQTLKLPDTVMDHHRLKKFSIIEKCNQYLSTFQVGTGTRQAQSLKFPSPKKTRVPAEYYHFKKAGETFEFFQGLAIKMSQKNYIVYPDNAVSMFSDVYNKEGSLVFELVFKSLIESCKDEKTQLKIYYLEGTEKAGGRMNVKFLFPKTETTTSGEKKKLDPTTLYIFFMSINEGSFGHYGVFVRDLENHLFYFDSMLASSKAIEEEDGYFRKFYSILTYKFNVPHTQDQVIIEFPDHPEAYSMEITGGSLYPLNKYLVETPGAPIEWYLKSHIMNTDSQNHFCFMWALLYCICKIHHYLYKTIDWLPFQNFICSNDLIPLFVIKSFVYYTIPFFKKSPMVNELWAKNIFLRNWFFSFVSNHPTQYKSGTLNPANNEFKLVSMRFPKSSMELIESPPKSLKSIWNEFLQHFIVRTDVIVNDETIINNQYVSFINSAISNQTLNSFLQKANYKKLVEHINKVLDQKMYQNIRLTPDAYHSFLSSPSKRPSTKRARS